MRDWKHNQVDSHVLLEGFITKLSKYKVIGWDIETTGLDCYQGDDIVGIGFGVLTKQGVITWYIPLKYTSEKSPLVSQIFNLISPIMADASVKKITANGKFDRHFFEQQGIVVNGLEDIQILARLLRTEYEKVSLNELIKREFGVEHEEEKELKEWWRKNKVNYSSNAVKNRYAIAPPEVVGKYCGSDVRWTLLLAEKYFQELHRDKKILNLYQKVERPLNDAVFKMEASGVRIDIPYLMQLESDMLEGIAEAEKVIKKEDPELNINSNKQLQEVFKRLGVEPEQRRRKKKDGETTFTDSYDSKVLKKYEHIPFVDALLTYKELTKLVSSYTNPTISDSSGHGVHIVHPDIRQESARTGRMSILRPPLQTVPRSSKYNIRKMIVPLEEGNRLLLIDYSNIEYRLLSHFANDPGLIKIYTEGDGDFHGTVANSKEIKEVLEEIEEDQGKRRDIAKKFNFAELYGSGVKHLSSQTGIPERVCETIIKRYRQAYPGVERFKSQVKRYAERNGGIRNPFGRWRKITPSKSYVAVNTLIQSTAADIMKIALIRIQGFLKGKLSKLLFPVHDEAVINWDFEDGDIVHPIVETMQTFKFNEEDLFRVPICVDVSVCDSNWGEKHSFNFLEYLELVHDGKLSDMSRKAPPKEKRKVDTMQVPKRKTGFRSIKKLRSVRSPVEGSEMGQITPQRIDSEDTTKSVRGSSGSPSGK